MNRTTNSLPLIIILAGIISVSHLWAQTDASSPDNPMPWVKICQDFDPNTYASHVVNGLANYAFSTDQEMHIQLSSNPDTSNTNRELAIYKWQEDQWQISQTSLSYPEANSLTIADGISEEGLYEILFTTGDTNISAPIAYVIVNNDWQTNVIALMQQLKLNIESAPDTHLVQSSLVISHIDRALEIITNSMSLSAEAIDSIKNVIQNENRFRAGEFPDFVSGINKIRIRTFEFGNIAEFALYIPPNYDPSIQWPLRLFADEYHWSVNRYGSSEDSLLLYWHSISHNDMQWAQYEMLWRILTEKLSIDEDRVYIYGGCANGIATMALALNYPDRWAECHASLGNSYRHLSGNALNLTLMFPGGHWENQNLIAYYDFAVKCFQYYGCNRVVHSYTPSTAQIPPQEHYTSSRNRHPQRVLFTTESLDNARSYWAQIDGRVDENLFATIDATVVGQTLYINTTNIDAYSIDLNMAPLNPTAPISIIESAYNNYPNIAPPTGPRGQDVCFATTEHTAHVYSFDLGMLQPDPNSITVLENDNCIININSEYQLQRQSQRYQHAALVKTDELNGTFQNVFNDNYLLVYGTGNDDAYNDAARNAANRLANRALCISDANVAPGMIADYNLVIVGLLDPCCCLAEISEHLPISTNGRQIQVNGNIYEDSDYGYMLIYPNPLNPNKYVLMLSAISTRAIQDIDQYLSQTASFNPSDVAVYELDADGNLHWHVLEKLSTLWTWQPQYDEIIATDIENFASWRWKQWLAHVIREEMAVDAVICEQHLKSNYLPTGQITLRSLFNTFNNDWIVKIRMPGEDLRRLLMAPFAEDINRGVDAPVLDGITFSNPQTTETDNILAFNEIENNQLYTLAFPYRCLNGQRMGIVLQNYDIIGEAYIIPMIIDYLSTEENYNLDEQLANIQPSTF